MSLSQNPTNQIHVYSSPTSTTLKKDQWWHKKYAKCAKNIARSRVRGVVGTEGGVSFGEDCNDIVHEDDGVDNSHDEFDDFLHGEKVSAVPLKSATGEGLTAQKKREQTTGRSKDKSTGEGRTTQKKKEKTTGGSKHKATGEGRAAQKKKEKTTVGNKDRSPTLNKAYEAYRSTIDGLILDIALPLTQQGRGITATHLDDKDDIITDDDWVVTDCRLLPQEVAAEDACGLSKHSRDHQMQDEDPWVIADVTDALPTPLRDERVRVPEGEDPEPPSFLLPEDKSTLTPKSSDRECRGDGDRTEVLTDEMLTREACGGEDASEWVVAELCGGDGSFGKRFLQAHQRDNDDTRMRFLLLERNSTLIGAARTKLAPWMTSSGNERKGPLMAECLQIDVASDAGQQLLESLTPAPHLWIASGSTLNSQVGSPAMAEPTLVRLTRSLRDGGYLIITGFSTSFLSPALIHKAGLIVREASLPSSMTDGHETSAGRFQILLLQKPRKHESACLPADGPALRPLFDCLAGLSTQE